LAVTAVTSAGCLPNIEFHCFSNYQCGASGVCEPSGFCSIPDSSCPFGRRFSDSAGDLSNKCVGDPGPDAGVDAPAPIDGTMNVVCPAPYASVNGSAHRYKILTNVSWTTAAGNCKLTSTSAYLAVPDNAPELVNLATAANALPFWIGLDDNALNYTFMTQKGVTATFLPWATNQPDTTSLKDCVNGISTTEIATDKCNVQNTAVCECEP
jgi:hypothetical protein